MMTGRSAMAWLWRRILRTSRPLSPGIMMSRRTASKVWVSSIAKARCPSAARATVYPRRSRRRPSISRFISSSSTNKIFAIGVPLSIWAPGADAGGHQVTDLAQQPFATVHPLVEDLFHIAIETAAVVGGEVHGGHDHNGDRPPLVVLANLHHELET